MNADVKISVTNPKIAAATPVEVVTPGSGGRIFLGTPTLSALESRPCTDIGPFSYPDGDYADVASGGQGGSAGTGTWDSGYWPTGPLTGSSGSPYPDHHWDMTIVFWLRAGTLTDSFGRQYASFEMDGYLQGPLMRFYTNNGDTFDWLPDTTYVEVYGERVGYYDGGDYSDREDVHQQSTGSPIPQDDEWHMVACTYGSWGTKSSPDFSFSGTLKLYIDSVLVDSTSVPYHIPSDYLTPPQGGSLGDPYTQPWLLEGTGDGLELSWSTTYMDTRGAAYFPEELSSGEISAIWASGPPEFDSDGSDSGASTVMSYDPGAFWVVGPSIVGIHSLAYVDFQIENETDCVMLRGLATYSINNPSASPYAVHRINFTVGRRFLDTYTEESSVDMSDMGDSIVVAPIRGTGSLTVPYYKWTALPMELIEANGLDYNGASLSDQLEPGIVYRAYLYCRVPPSYGSFPLEFECAQIMAFVGESGTFRQTTLTTS